MTEQSLVPDDVLDRKPRDARYDFAKAARA
jgi:hypothetical protein